MSDSYITALSDPDNWEAKWDQSSDWIGFERWKLWTVISCTGAHVKWRRKPVGRRQLTKGTGGPATMTAEDAEMYLRENRSRIVADRQGDPWKFSGAHFEVSGSYDRFVTLPEKYAPYTPLVPAGSQMAEVERLPKELAESRAASRGFEKACDGLRRELVNAIGSQKAAVAELEVERTRFRKLAHSSECLVRRLTGSGTRSLLEDVAELLPGAEFSESTKVYLNIDARKET